MTTSSRFALAAAILLAVPAAAQADPGSACASGTTRKPKAAFLGAEMLFRIVPEIYFNPNVEAVLVDDGHYFTINGDFHYDFLSGRRTFAWLGAGLAVAQYRPRGIGRGRHRRRARPAGRDRGAARTRDPVRAGKGDPEERHRVRDRRRTAVLVIAPSSAPDTMEGFIGGSLMDRRDFLRSAGIVTAGLAWPGSRASFAQSPSPRARWRTFEIVTRAEVLEPSGPTRVWVPPPLGGGDAVPEGDDHHVQGRRRNGEARPDSRPSIPSRWWRRSTRPESSPC